jgi:hypothetical protein
MDEDDLGWLSIGGLPSYAIDPYADEFSDPAVSPASVLGGTEAADQAYRTSPGSASATGWDRLFSNIKNIGGKALNFAGTNQGIMAILAALASTARSRARATPDDAAAKRIFPRSG